MPAVGSSRNTRAGSWTNAAASARRRCIPPDTSRTFLSRCSSSSTHSSTWCRRWRRRSRSPYIEAWKLRFSHSDRSGNSAGICGR